MIKQTFVNSAYAPVRRGVICRQTLEIGKIQKSKSSKLDELEEIVYEEDNGADEEIEPDTTLKGADGQKWAKCIKCKTIYPRIFFLAL